MEFVPNKFRGIDSLRYAAEESAHYQNDFSVPQKLSFLTLFLKLSAAAFCFSFSKTNVFSPKTLRTKSESLLFVPRSGIPSIFLFIGIVWKGIPRVFSSAEQPEFRRNKLFISSIPSFVE